MVYKLPVVNREPSPTRRTFLKGAAVAGAAGAVALGKTAHAACPADAPTVYPAQDESEVRWAFLVDLRRCVGCNACAVACKTENDIRLGYFRNGVIQHESGKYPDTARKFVPWLCNHCATPPCMDECPVEPVKASFKFPGGDTAEYYARGTYQRPDGMVLVDQQRCIGCGKCVTACPYGARYLDPVKEAGGKAGGRAADKCTLCVHRLQNGVVPACVNTCPHDARMIGNYNDPNGKLRKAIDAAGDQVSVLLENAGTAPRCFYIGLDELAYLLGDEPRKEAGLQLQVPS